MKDILTLFIPAVLLLSWGTACATAEDWPEFRGPTGQGLSSATSLPVKWDLQANDLQEPTLASCAVVDRAMIVRTERHLYRIE